LVPVRHVLTLRPPPLWWLPAAAVSFYSRARHKPSEEQRALFNIQVRQCSAAFGKGKVAECRRKPAANPKAPERDARRGPKGQHDNSPGL
ncbi:MAG TPA: hypothetical protein VGM54_24920, partial [Chthoniobacter sp.]